MQLSWFAWTNLVFGRLQRYLITIISFVLILHHNGLTSLDLLLKNRLHGLFPAKKLTIIHGRNWMWRVRQLLRISVLMHTRHLHLFYHLVCLLFYIFLTLTIDINLYLLLLLTFFLPSFYFSLLLRSKMEYCWWYHTRYGWGVPNLQSRLSCWIASRIQVGSKFPKMLSEINLG